MKHLKLFFALFAMLALGVGNAWGADFTLTSANSVTVDGVTVTFATGSGSTAPTWYAAGLRLYAKNTVTITSESEITSIVFDWEKQGSKTFASVSANTGSYSHPSAAGKGTWTGSSKSVIFTLASTSGVQLQLNTLSVTTAGSTTPKQKYTLTYQAGSVTGSLEVEEGANLLDALEDITPVACDPTSTGPIGWSESEITTKQANAPTLLTDADVMPSEAHSVYYVFAKKETIGGGAATDITIDLSKKDQITTNTTSSLVFTVGDVTFTNTKVSGSTNANNYCPGTTGKTYTSTRTYNGHQVTIASANTISKIVITAGTNAYATAIQNATWTNATASASNTTVTITPNAGVTSVSFKPSATAGMTKVVVTTGGGTTTIFDYTTSCSGSTEPVPSLTASSSLDFGSVANESSNEKSLTVSGQNLTEDVTLSIDGTNKTFFSVAPTTIKKADEISQEIVVTYTPATEGSHTGTLIIKSGEITQNVTLSGKSFVLTGAGTEDNPYTATDIITLALEDKTKAWVEGYIIGVMENNKLVANTTSTNSNIVLANAAEEDENYVPVALPSGNIRTALNLQENSSNLGKKVAVYGTLEKYFSRPGVKEVSEYNWIVEEGELAAPTFSVAEGEYTEAKSITISAAEGTIYYTLDGTTPDSESTKYTTPIILDECGEHTIKAIAISSDSESPVASATYEIQLPILANSAVDPYTEAEAIDVYNSGCYDGEELVYVTGTVQTAQFYNSGTYTITLTGGMQFYYFYEGADEDVFESDYINEGDDIVACGKLSMHTTIYQLAKGCYLVKHKPVAQLSWSKSTCTAEIGAENEFPTLTNTNSVAVSYSSSNTAAATINETTGEITLVAAGKTTITATFAENENYKANSASYTLTVAEAVVRGTITYNTNGGTEVAAQENQTNLPETLPTTTKAGYNFGGWYTDAECNTPAVANSVLTGDITLHAKWLEPYTVAQALAMNATTGVYVKGIISTITEVNTGHKNATYKISDDGTTTSEMIVYRGKNVGNTDFTSEDQIAVGDIVVIYGNLSMYNSAIQLAQGNYIYSLTKPTLYTVTISFETNGGETVASIEANTLPDPLPTTTKEGHAFDGWYMDNALTIPAVAGTPITTDADITLYAKWVEVSKWATTYTSNIEVGSDEYSVIIGGITYENQSQRYGNGSTAGYATLYLPAETETLHFHAAGWNSEDVTITAKIGEEILGTFELEKDAGISGNSKTYTLQGNTSTEQYFYIDLTSYTIAANTAITFEATEGKRFVLYGVNQEGGIAPELNRIEITGEATTLTYEIGDVFDPAGLGVNAIYTLAGVDHETVAIDAEDVEWSFDPATIAAETSQVEVTATYMEKTATKTVAGLTINVPTPEITATPASIDWGTVNKDSEASKEVTVTLKAVANATISISGTNPSTFSVDKTALTETGTIVVSANTSSVGTFTATLTISDDAAAAEEKKISLKIIVEGIDDVYGNWQLVTDASTLKAGDKIIIASVAVEDKYYTMGKQNSNNRAAIESTVSETQLTPTTGTSVLTLVDAGDGKFAFQASNGKYLSAAGTGDNNYLREAENYDSDKTKWTISVTAEGVATIKATSDNRNWMRYNKSSIIFSCYGSGQTDIALYKRVPDYTRTTSAGRYGTICLPGNIVKCLGATLYEVAGKEGSRVVFDEVLNPKAGMPYIFLAHNAEVLFYCGDQTADAGNHNSLYGTFTELKNSELEGKYMVQNNKIVKCNPANSGVAENRAYFKGSELEVLGKPGAQMPGRKRITMGTESENTATGTEDVVAPAGQTFKIIENGQLIIIRDGVKYNAQGVRF